jgi:hypothetical protein
MIRAAPENFAPYAPAKAVIDVIRRAREKGLPSDPMTTDTLEMIGIPSTMTGPTLKALVFLQLLDEGGNRMEAFNRMQRVATEEYPGLLAEIIRKAYLPVFTIIDPEQDEFTTISDAFRKYDPVNQRQKMIRLFMGLCEEAGIIKSQPKRRQLSQASKSKPKSEKSVTKPITRMKQDNTEIEKSNIIDSGQGETATYYRLISAIIQQLPNSGHWNSEKRKRWLDAMTSAIDLLIELRDEQT